MKQHVIIATDPDDVYLEGFRILLIDLSLDQGQIVSASLLNMSLTDRVILYTWNPKESIEWMLDKKTKCDLIIFNADGYNDIITGYMAAQKNSYYFGNLKLLSSVNNSRLYAQADCEQLLEYMTVQHG